MKAHSGIQKQVLNLYREALRTVRKKGGTAEQQRNNLSTIQKEFRKNAMEIPRKDFRTIEFMIRQGERRLKDLASEDVTSVKVFTIPR